MKEGMRRISASLPHLLLFPSGAAQESGHTQIVAFHGGSGGSGSRLCRGLLRGLLGLRAILRLLRLSILNRSLILLAILHLRNHRLLHRNHH